MDYTKESLLIPALMIIALFIVLRITTLWRQKEHMHLHGFLVNCIKDLSTEIVPAYIGLIFLAIGIALLNQSAILVALAVFFIIVGYQIILWAVGIESEYIGNVPNHAENKRGATFNHALDNKRTTVREP